MPYSFKKLENIQATDDAMSRCISEKVHSGCDQEQAIAICYRELKAQAKAQSKMHEFDLIGSVGEEITPIAVSQMLAEANGEDVTFYIASLGGSLSDGNSIYGIIKKYKGNTRGVIIGHTASAGTIAILGCDTVVCNSNSPFLIHNSSISDGGNALELKKKAGELEKQDKMMIQIYKEKTSLDENKIAELMAKEDWLTPEEALEFGFIDEIVEPKYKAVAYKPASYLSKELLTKLEKKMKNPFKKEAKVINILALADGKNLLMNADAAAAGVEVAPVGAATLEDGTFELADGRKITVAGGVITEVVEKEAVVSEEENMQAEIVAAIAEIIVEETDKIRNEFNAKLALIKSDHKPPKGKEIHSNVVDPDKKDVHDKVADAVAEVRKSIVDSRKN